MLLDLSQADKPSTPVSKVTTPTCSGAPTLPGSSGVKSAVPGVVLPPGAYPPFSLVAGGVGGSRSSDTSPYNSVAPSPYSRPPMVGFQREQFPCTFGIRTLYNQTFPVNVLWIVNLFYYIYLNPGHVHWASKISFRHAFVIGGMCTVE